MKKYIATFWRGNPQLKDGGYETTREIEVLCMDDSHEKAVLEWLNYGAMRGIGQWRNSGKGRFTYEVLD